ncbi:acyl-CoA N-acyltransferase [Blastocladiella britannica]|nr:acyl-CoA N-acyltransferase [Blastocladiella britannica]
MTPLTETSPCKTYRFEASHHSHCVWWTDFHASNPTVKAAFYTGNTLPPLLFDACFALVEANMQDQYNAVDVWDRDEKRAELLDPQMRFLVLVDHLESVCGALIFQFSTEEDADGDWENPIGYCYEIQVRSDCQGLGMGKFMVQWVADICHGAQMKQLLLTVFKINEQAIKFYLKQGFRIDGTSPSNFEDEDGNPLDVNYEILSLDLVGP